MDCTSCARPVPDGSRFCPSCGHAIVAGAAEERRVVTVLFGDLVGFTSLAERLDPEHVKRLVDACFERLVDDVVAYGGRVDKLLGDGIVALFGAPVAHEDDAERAVRAALRMQATLFEQVANLGAGEAPIRMRIGINTGEVLVGKLAGTDYTAMGDVVNAASRLQEAAPAGGVLVGDVTYARTSDAIRYQPAGEIVVKGRAKPITTWLAHEAVVPPGGRRRRRDVPLVGRSTEMRLGRAALDVALQGKRAVLLAIEGEGGAGKSRLVEELLSPVRERAVVLEGACVPYGEANVWWPIASALIDRLELDTNAPPATSAVAARELALQHGQVLFGSDSAGELENLADAFCHLLGYPSGLDAMDPAGAREALFRAVTTVLQAMLAESAVVLAVTDAHWADPHVLELLARVAGSLAHAPFALITTSRADADLRWPPATRRVTVVAVPLEPLSREAAARVVWSVVGHELDEATIAQIYDRSGGNPLFLEELAELVADGGDVGQLPDSLRGLVAARLDRLAPAQRAVLDNAAVLGTTGFLFSLEKFAVELGQPFDDSLIEGLVGQGLLEVDGRRWRFRSDSVREVAYQTLTKSVRAARHAGVARSMATAGVHAPLDDLAHHAATAAELVVELGSVDGVPPDMRDAAVGHLVLAAERASEQGSLHTVVRHTTRAIDLLGPEVSVLGRNVLLLRAGAEVETRDYRAARHDIELVLDASLGDGDVVSEAEARRLLGMIHQQHLEIDRARDELGRAVELLKGSGEQAPLARALRARGFLELFGGSLQDAEWFFGEAESVYRDLNDRRGLAWVEQHRAWASFLSGDVIQAEERLHAAAAALHEVGDRSGVGWAFGLLAFVHFINRRFAEAEELAKTVIEEASERGEEWGLGMMQVLLANLRIWQGNPEEALALAEQARSRFRRLGDRFGLLQAMVPLLRSLVATGRQAATAREMEELVVLGRSFGGEAFGSLAAGGAMMHAGDGRKAVELTSETIEHQQFIGVPVFEPYVVQAIGFAQCGQMDEALVALELVGADHADDPFTKAGAALLAVLGGRPGDAIVLADGVDPRHGASYFDQVLAQVASGAAHAAQGAIPAAEAALVAAVELAIACGDVVLTALAAQAHLHVLGRAPMQGTGDLSVLGDGWRSVVSMLPVAPLSPVAGR